MPRLTLLLAVVAGLLVLGQAPVLAQPAAEVEKVLVVRWAGEPTPLFVDIAIRRSADGKQFPLVTLDAAPGRDRARVSLPAGECLLFIYHVTPAGADADAPPLHHSEIRERLTRRVTNTFFFDFDSGAGRVEPGGERCFGDTSTESALSGTPDTQPPIALLLVAALGFGVAYLRAARTPRAIVPTANLRPANTSPSASPRRS